MISLFDAKCLNALLHLREPWRVPSAAQAWSVDCLEAQGMISRYMMSGWCMMTHPGHYRLTTAGQQVVSSTYSNVEHPTRLPAHIERRMTLHTMTQIAACGTVTTQTLARITGKTDEAARKTLRRFSARGWVVPCSREGRFQEWALTEAGAAEMKDLASR